MVHVLRIAPHRWNASIEHSLPVRGQSAHELLALATRPEFELVHVTPQIEFPVLGNKIAGEVHHALKIGRMPFSVYVPW